MNRLNVKQTCILIILFILLSPSIIFARSVPMVKSVMVHFAEVPPIQLPCGDIELIYYPEYAKHAELLDLKTVDSLRVQHKTMLETANKIKIQLAKNLENFLMAGYAYFRAMQSPDVLVQKDAELRFMYRQMLWYSKLAEVAYAEYTLRDIARKYYKQTALLFKNLNYNQRVALIDKFSKRLACLHEHRQAAFDKISKTKRSSAKALFNSTKNKTITIEQASKRATDIAKFSGFSREYAWMVADVASLTTILRTLLTAHETALLNKKLHPELMKIHKKYGAALGPKDKFPKDSQTIENRRIRLEITKTRAQIALNHMVLKQVQAEKIFTSQLNFSSGITAGLSKVGSIAKKAYKDFIKTSHLLPYEKPAETGKNFKTGKQPLSFDKFKKKHKSDPLTVELSIIAIAYESANATFMLTASSVKDIILSWLPSEISGKTNAEKARDIYLLEKKKIDFSINVIKKIINDLDPNDPDSFKQGQALMGFIVIGKPFDSQIALQVPNEIHRLLEDENFIAATGGGLGWILEPLCEGPVQRNSLLMHAARYALTGNARTAFHRIAFDRGIVLDNPDLPLTKDILKGNSNADYASDGYQKLVTQASSQGLTNGIYFIPVLGQAKYAYDKIPEIRSLLKFEGKNEPTQDEFLLNLISQQELFDQVIAALKRVRYNYATLSLKDPHSFNKHLSLLIQSPEYLAAYINIRNAFWERSKMFNSVRYSKYKSERLKSEGKAILSSIDRAHELEITDLTARRAYLKMAHHLSSINYIAAVQELKALQTAENIRRKAYGIKARVDLSESIAAFNKETRLSRTILRPGNRVAQQLASVL
ncbi:MAG: hypothetical protein L3J69_07210 [Desulfobacula sp.]|nr:hypothetical protein [Desulfobacula sp.]